MDVFETKTERVKQLCRKLRPVVGTQIDKIWQAYLIEDNKGKGEIEEYLKLLSASVISERLEKDQIFLFPPSKERAAGSYYIGDVLYNKKCLYPFGLREKEWIQHVGIFGRSGAGKTNLGFSIVSELFKKNKPFIIFDWKRNYRDLSALPDFHDLLVFTVGRNIAPLRFNPLIPPQGTDPRTWLKKIIEVVAHSYFLGEGVMYLLQKAINSVYRRYGVYDGSVNQYPTFRDVLRWFDKYKAKGREANWLSSTLRAISTICFGEMNRLTNIGNQQIEQLLKKKVILELDALTQSDKIFFIEALLLWIHHYRLREKEREAFKHAVIIEEAHHILSGEKASLTGGESIMETTFREIREFGESLIILDQHPFQISLPALGNTYTTIVMNLKHKKDVNTIAQCMMLDRTEKEYPGNLEIGEAIVRLQGRIMKPFLIKIPEFEIKKGVVTDEILREKMLRYFGYLRGKQPLIQDITHISKTAEVREEEKMLLIDILKHPFSAIVRRYQRLNLNRRKGNFFKDNLINKGYIIPKEIRLSNGRIMLFELTEKARQYLESLGYYIKRDRNGIEHRFWKWRVAKYYQERGYQVFIEKKINGGVDVAVKQDNMSIAIEIETGTSDFIKNILRDLKRGYSLVISVATNEIVENRIKVQLAKRKLDKIKRLKVTTVRAFE
ncbi:MAG: ATP-binding protein [Candidatus Hodarchaeota archaeon]